MSLVKKSLGNEINFNFGDFLFVVVVRHFCQWSKMVSERWSAFKCDVVQGFWKCEPRPRLQENSSTHSHIDDVTQEVYGQIVRRRLSDEQGEKILINLIIFFLINLINFSKPYLGKFPQTIVRIGEKIFLALGFGFSSTSFRKFVKN